MFFTVSFWLGMASTASDAQVLTSVAKVRTLERAAAARSLPVRLKGTVTFVNRAAWATYGFVQAGDDAIYFQLRSGLEPPPVGRRVALEATTMPGEFAPSLNVHSFRVVGPSKLPHPASDQPEALLSGRLDSRWVSVEGVVRRWHFDDASQLHVLTLDRGTRAIRVELPGRVDQAQVKALVGARVQAEGPCGARFNALRQIVGARVFSPSLALVRVLKPALSSWSELPLDRIGALLEYQPTARTDGLRRVVGTVTWRQPGLAVVEDESGALKTELAPNAILQLGDRVELAGYAVAQGLTPLLEDARILSRSPGDRLVPSGLSAFVPAAQLRLVRVRGLIESRTQWGRGTEMVVKVDDRSLRVLSFDALSPAAQPSAEIQVCGVAHPIRNERSPRFASPDQYAEVASEVELWLSSPNQLTILRAASPWSLRRVLVGAAVLGAVLLGSLGWGMMLKTQVTRHTQTIKAQLAEQEDLRARAQAANEAKSLFLGTMSHELRTPLHGIVGTVSLALEDPPPSDELRGQLEQIRSSGRQLERLINDLLDVSLAGRGEIVLEPEPVDIRSLIEPYLEGARIQAQDKGLELRWVWDPGVPIVVETDPKRLLQVVDHLLSNALKFTEVGEINVRISRPRSDHLEVRVRDTGAGVPEAARGQLFDRFLQADNSITRRFGGAGLGLAVCRELVQLMGGEIRCESVLGKGSEFRFQVVAPERLKRSASLSLVLPSSGRRSVLIVDDSAINLKILERMLARLDCDVRIATNGSEAVKVALSESFDLILMDLHMPQMNGIEATQEIRQQLGEHAPPVLAVTADVLPATRQACEAAGMRGVLSKPLDLETLRSALFPT